MSEEMQIVYKDINDLQMYENNPRKNSDAVQKYAIYAIRNKNDGKIYIGQTQTDIKVRFWRHSCSSSNCKSLRKAIQKDGKDNFEVAILDYALSIEEADRKEVFWIKKLETNDANYGYNLTTGGHSWKFTESVRKEMSENRQGENNSFYHKHHSDEQREKWSKERKGLYEGAKHPKAKRVRCIETGKVYECIKDAELDTGANRHHITQVCKGQYGRKTVKGLHWIYEQ